MVKAELTFRDGNGHLVVIMPHVINRLLAHRQLHSSSLEAAGVLIGERRGHHMVVKDASAPGKGDLRSRYSVDRCGSHHQQAVDEAFRRSEGRLQYLGEWHTHPEDSPSPSCADLRSWRRHIADPEHMILIIVGRNQIWVAKKIVDVIVPLVEIL